MKITRRQALAGSVFGLAGSVGITGSQAKRKAGNGHSVIIVTIDDMAGAVLDYPGIVLPNVQRLAALGARFKNAMAHVPACSPSRCALWSGIAANRTGVYYNSHYHLNARVPAGHRWLFDYVRSQTGGKIKLTGKIYHGEIEEAFLNTLPARPDKTFAPRRYAASIQDSGKARSQYQMAHPGNSMIDFGPGRKGGRADDAVTAWAAKRIKRGFLAGHPGSVLGLGLYRPHTPHVVPPAYFDLYPESPDTPPGFLAKATSWSDNLADLEDEPRRADSMGNRGFGRKLDMFDENAAYRRAYYASCSFADAKLGEVLDAWQAAALERSVYLIVTSDHGYLLGHKGRFRKFALWEQSLKVPLFIAGPGIRPGTTISRPVSLLDIYPTVCGLVGIDVPDWCDGRDLSKRLRGEAVLKDRPVVSIWGDEQRGIFYASARNRRGRIIDYGGGRRSGYDHDPGSPDFDPYELNNIASTMDPALKAALLAALPQSFAPPRDL